MGSPGPSGKGCLSWRQGRWLNSRGKWTFAVRGCKESIFFLLLDSLSPRPTLPPLSLLHMAPRGPVQEAGHAGRSGRTPAIQPSGRCAPKCHSLCALSSGSPSTRQRLHQAAVKWHDGTGTPAAEPFQGPRAAAGGRGPGKLCALHQAGGWAGVTRHSCSGRDHALEMAALLPKQRRGS